MLTGNKGEWSEIYALLKILADKQLFAGDSNLNPIGDLQFPVIKIIRDEPGGNFEFSYEDEWVTISGEKKHFKIPISNFQNQASFLLTALLKTTQASFQVPETEAFIKSFDCFSLKAKASVKSDIRVVIHDRRTGTTPQLGFSIKSQLGGASTLLNAGRTTNFIYKIEGTDISDENIAAINTISTRCKIKDRIEAIRSLNGRLTFYKTENLIFGNNLILVDSYLALIFGEILLKYYSSNISKMVDLVDYLTNVNPLTYNLSTGHPYYAYKIKRFLKDIALGMMPSKVWTGELDATGGYLVIKGDGEILCYHIYNSNEFEDYLLNNTKLETASSTRHDFGSIYREEGELFFKLNLQIRFLR